MAIEQGIWKLASGASEAPQKLRPMGLADEGKLEEQIMQDVSIPGLALDRPPGTHRLR